MNDALQELRDAEVISDLDQQFGRFMARLSPESGPLLALAAALACRSVSGGGVCLDLQEVLERPPEGLARRSLPGSAKEWIAALEAAPVVGKPGDFTPLVLDAQGRLYLHRYWEYERRLAEDLLARAGSDPGETDDERLKTVLNRLLGPAPQGETDWQRVAAAVAAMKRLCVISGGPGTGKTHTVVRILALLQELEGGRLRMGLAAPTGKAAARLEEVVREKRGDTGVSEEVKRLIPDSASTIHRLLGYRPYSTVPLHNRERLLPLDVLVVDESSMVALPLMARLVDALPAGARLILLGDRDQLASVEAGRVLGDICAGETEFSSAFGRRVGKVAGMKPAQGKASGSLSDSIVVLKKDYRFSGGGIGELARLVNEGRGEEALSFASGGGDGSVVWRDLSPGRLREEAVGLLADGYRPCLEAARGGTGAPGVLSLFDGFRILSALRRGGRGVRELNRLVESRLSEAGLLDSRDRNYVGRPVMVTVNDYTVRLFNGDIGMILADPASCGEPRGFFKGEEGKMRAVVPARLPEHETAWAMTVHKSQGSEFDRVVLVLPDDAGSPALSRELVYTGLTRARRKVEIWGAPQVFLAAVERRTERSSGLRERLWGRSPP